MADVVTGELHLPRVRARLAGQRDRHGTVRRAQPGRDHEQPAAPPARRRRGDEQHVPELGDGAVDRHLFQLDDPWTGPYPAAGADQRARRARRTRDGREPGSCATSSHSAIRLAVGLQPGAVIAGPHRDGTAAAYRRRLPHRPQLLPRVDLRTLRQWVGRRLRFRDSCLPHRGYRLGLARWYLRAPGTSCPSALPSGESPHKSAGSSRGRTDDPVAAIDTEPAVSSPNGVAVQPARAASVPDARAGWGLPLVVLIVGMFMSILDTSIVNVAIPTLQNAFGTTTDEVQWIATSYTLALGVVVPLSAWLSDRFGAGRTYNVSLLAFAAGSALCGLAWNLESMVVFRIIQAIPGGILPVVTLSMVYRIVPREKIGAAMGMYGLGIIVAPAIGPTLGGYLVEYVDWRLIFFINVPVGILGAIAAVIVLPKFPAVKSQKFDLLGFLTIAGGLFTLLLALSEGQDWGWTGYRVISLLSASVILLALFVIIELEVEHPLLDVRVFRYWPYTNSLLLISVLMVGLFATLFYIPLFLQQAQGLGAFDAGVLLLPQALVMAVLMPIAGRPYV